MEPGKVMVLGSANFDLIFEAAHFPTPGETVLVPSMATSAGGKGANQAAAASRLGAKVWMVGALGADSFGDALETELREAGVNTEFLQRRQDAGTGVASVYVVPSGENTCMVSSGANMRVDPSYAVSSAEHIKPRIVLCQLEIPVETVLAASLHHSCKGIFILNPAPAKPIPNELIAQSDIITPNVIETELLTGVRPIDESSARIAAYKLRDLGAGAVLITMSSAGCFLSSPGAECLMPARKVRAVDTTGAGDAFNGALAAFLAEGVDLAEAARFAGVYASLSVTKLGAQNSMPTREEFQAFLAQA